MANRHKAFKNGGKVHGREVDDGPEEVVKEAEKKKTGGAVKRKSGGSVPGFKTGGRLDKRARGGGVGADKNPFSSAKIKG